MRIEANGASFHVEVRGEGEPLLLLHGFTGSCRSFDAFVPKWSGQYQVIAIDIIGHGLSEMPADPRRYDIMHAVRDIAAILDALRVEQAHVLGYSMGGRLALSFAALEPGRVSSLILESSSPGLRAPEERQDRIRNDEQLAERIEQEGIEAFVEYWENIPLFQSVKRMPDAVQAAIRRQRLANAPLGLANSLRGMGTGAQPSWWDRLDRLTMAVQLIAGELDAKFDRIAEEMRRLIPNARYAKVPDAGHLVHVEKPQIFDTIVMKFLACPEDERLV